MDDEVEAGIRENRSNYIVDDSANKSNSAGKNGEQIARENERYVLREVARHGTIREDELAILLGWSKQMVQKTVLRLVDANLIIRARAHGSNFICLKKSKVTTADIFPSWRHNALAIQVLGQVRDQHSKSIIETEAEIRRRIPDGKIPDGIVTSPWATIRIETEMTNKTSKPMLKQCKEAILLAKQGITTVFAFPYPPTEFYKFNWEHRLASSIRTELGNDDPEPNIKFMRCHFKKITEFEHCRPAQFEVIDLPPLPTNSRIGQGKAILGTEVIQGYHWKCISKYSEGLWHNEIHELYYDNHIKGTFKFIDSPEGVAHEMMEQQVDGSWVRSAAHPHQHAWDPFDEFVKSGKFAAESLDADTFAFD
ncbi:MAG: helix-turn-helix domain-containing protein [Gallionellaceae bacterium]